MVLLDIYLLLELSIPTIWPKPYKQIQIIFYCFMFIILVYDVLIQYPIDGKFIDVSSLVALTFDKIFLFRLMWGCSVVDSFLFLSKGTEPPQLRSGHQWLCVSGTRGQRLLPDPGTPVQQRGDQLRGQTPGYSSIFKKNLRYNQYLFILTRQKF